MKAPHAALVHAGRSASPAAARRENTTVAGILTTTAFGYATVTSR
ncbi:hypothetical protein [Streptomyces nitrosporeus]